MIEGGPEQSFWYEKRNGLDMNWSEWIEMHKVNEGGLTKPPHRPSGECQATRQPGWFLTLTFCFSPPLPLLFLSPLFLLLFGSSLLHRFVSFPPTKPIPVDFLPSFFLFNQPGSFFAFLDPGCCCCCCWSFPFSNHLLLIARFPCVLLTVPLWLWCLVHCACDFPLTLIDSKETHYLQLSFKPYLPLFLFPYPSRSSDKYQRAIKMSWKLTKSMSDFPRAGLYRGSPVNILNGQLLKHMRSQN